MGRRDRKGSERRCQENDCESLTRCSGRVTLEYRHTHGWLAFEVLRRAEGGTLLFEEYERRLFHPAPEIREEASKILGVNGAYQHLKHIKHDIAKGRVVVEDAS